MLVLLAACAGPAANQPPAVTDAPAEPVSVGLADFKIEPSQLSVRGAALAIHVSSEGPTPHNLTVRDTAGETLLASSDLRAGQAAVISGQLPPGEYTIFCSFAGHESLGMSGTLTVNGN